MSPFPTFSRWRIATRDRSIGTSVSPHRVIYKYTHTHTVKNTANTSYVYISFSKRRLTISSLSRPWFTTTSVPRLPRRGVSETWGIYRGTSVVYETSFYPRVTNHTEEGRNCALHEKKMTYRDLEGDSKQGESRNRRLKFHPPVYRFVYIACEGNVISRSRVVRARGFAWG